LVDDPDETFDYVPSCCSGCGAGLGSAAEATTTAPTGVADAPTSYGPNLRAWIVHVLVFQHIPVARVVELVADLLMAWPSAGWVCQVLRTTATALAEMERTIRILLTTAHIRHMDETGTKVTGPRWWLHVADETHPDQHWPLLAIDALNTAADHARDQGHHHIPPDITAPLAHAWRHAIRSIAHLALPERDQVRNDKPVSIACPRL
jgi:Transposase IS66 family